mmetsp:Transcript_20339/g.47771  ORF Transcript_20339/g.47771 Transcript_20339/m.47771 type:complete len:130 (+) Transcript_20339:460-849(+)
MSRERQGLEQVAGQERNEAELLNGPSSEGEERNRDVVHARRFEDADGLFVPGSEAINPRTSPVPRLAPPPGKLCLLANRAGRGGGRGDVWSVPAGRVGAGDVQMDVDGTDEQRADHGDRRQEGGTRSGF